MVSKVKHDDPPPYDSLQIPPPCTALPTSSDNTWNDISADNIPSTTTSAYGSSYKYKTSPHSPLNRSRSCTDAICLFLFLAFLGSWVFVAYLGMKTGDIRKVLFPTDSQGQICGQGSLSLRPYLLIYDLSQCLSPSSLLAGCPTPHVCVAQCPQENYSPLGSAKLMLEDHRVSRRKLNLSVP